MNRKEEAQYPLPAQHVGKEKETKTYSSGDLPGLTFIPSNPSKC